MRAPVSVLLPAPGAPVTPTTCADPPARATILPTSRAAGPPRSTMVSNRASAPRSPERACSSSVAESADLGATRLDRHDLGHAVNAVAHDALNTGLQRLIRGWARAAGTDQRHRDHSGLLVNFAQLDVATIGVQDWPDDVNRLLHPLPHAHVDLISFSPPFYDTCVLAHQGGWDEILLVVAPITVIVLVLWRATRAAERRALDDGAESSDPPTPA